MSNELISRDEGIAFYLARDNTLMEIRHVELQDKAGWYLLDRHLPEAGFEEKVNNKQGYGMLMTSTQVDEDAQHFY